ncbi:MAG: glycerophosphodiester phosphodiesterase family protein [Ekhidna sp.]
MKTLKWIFVLTIACSSVTEQKKIDVQGHRGARGLMPENSIEGFIEAIDLGVSTLELDLVVSKDTQLIVSHEHFLSPEFCADLDGNRIKEDTVFNLYQMTANEIKQFDCGSLKHDRFPDQKKINTYKPTLHEVFDKVESYLASKNLPPVNYNIELKTTPETDSIFHPTPKAFSDLVYEFISTRNLWNRVNIQSFDFRTLEYFNEVYPEVRLAVLIEYEQDWKVNIEKLGFSPEIYSCYFELLSREQIKNIQESGMQVIPWTVNEVSDIKKMIDWDVDGIISDYPNRLIETITK